MSRNQSQVGTPSTDGQLSQFDFLLAAIPLALLTGVGSGLFFSVPQYIGVTLGAAVAAGLIGYSVYAISRIEPSQHPQRSRNSADSLNASNN